MNKGLDTNMKNFRGILPRGKSQELAQEAIKRQYRLNEKQYPIILITLIILVSSRCISFPTTSLQYMQFCRLNEFYHQQVRKSSNDFALVLFFKNKQR